MSTQFDQHRQERCQKQHKERMAKQLVHIGVAVSTVGDGLEYPHGSAPQGFIPERSNIINIAAACGDAYRFNENIAPQNGRYGVSSFWAKHPEEYAKLQHKPVPLEEAMVKLRAWLRQFQGTLVACSSSVDFWHLLHAFFKTGKDCPFGTVPIDTATLHMLRTKRLRPIPVADRAEPLAVARARWEAVTGGMLPNFGAKVPPKRVGARPKPPPPQPLDGGLRLPIDPAAAPGIGRQAGVFRDFAAQALEQRQRMERTRQADALRRLAGQWIPPTPPPTWAAAVPLELHVPMRDAEEGGAPRRRTVNVQQRQAEVDAEVNARLNRIIFDAVPDREPDEDA